MSDKPDRPKTDAEHHEAREGWPGITIIGGHVISDGEAAVLGIPPMSDDAIPDNLKRGETGDRKPRQRNLLSRLHRRKT